MKIITIILLIAAGSLFGDTIWEDGFEENSEWILSGEFELGTPQGLGGEHGNPDPTSAFEGLHVLGVDLNGGGGYLGDYENNLGEDEYSAISPNIDCSGFLNVEFSFMKWLNVETSTYDHAYIDVSSDDGTTWVEIWTNSVEITNSSWSLDTFDISEIVDLQENVRVRFTIGPTDSSWQYSGWNIDNFIVSGDPVVYGAIEGNIVNSANNDPVPFAQIASPFGNALSDDEGYFLLTGIPTGNRIITVNAIGFFPFESDDILVTENDTTYVLCEMYENTETPPSPQNLEALVIDENNVQLTWEAPASRDVLLAYNVYRNGYIITSILEEEFLDLNLVNGEYSYFVTAVYDIGESLPSNEIIVQIEATGIDELVAADFKMWNYPNPFNPETTISFSINENEVGNLSIYNLKGQEIFKEKFEAGDHQYNWNAKAFTSGIYFYKLKTDHSSQMKKMILLK